jgi:TPR repeat protein
MARMKQILIMLIAVVMVGCGKKDESAPQVEEKLPQSGLVKEQEVDPKVPSPTTSTKPEPQAKPKESTEEEIPLSEVTKQKIARAESGDADAQYGLAVDYRAGIGLAKDAGKSAKWCRKAAEQGHVEAQWQLAVIYQNGEGVEKDLKEAAKWYRKAAEQGDAHAQYELGFVYQNGEGVEKDLKEAVKWYRKAADQGFASAQNLLRFMYTFGKGVPEDGVTAYAWCSIAAANGNALSKKYKGSIAKELTSAQIAQAEALVKEMIRKNPKLLKKKE